MRQHKLQKRVLMHDWYAVEHKDREALLAKLVALPLNEVTEVLSYLPKPKAAVAYDLLLKHAKRIVGI